MRDHRSKTLQRLRELPSGALVATGAWLAVRSFDQGISWHEFGEYWLRDEDILDICEQDGHAVAFTKGEEDLIRVWKGKFAVDQWQRTSSLWDGWLVHAEMTSRSGVVAGLYDGDTLHVLSSFDFGETWERVLKVEPPGTLHHFVVNSAGVAVAVFLNKIECINGSDSECTVIALDVPARRIIHKHTFLALVQCIFNCGEHEWLLGAASGLLFSYNSQSNHLQVRAVHENGNLNITGIHTHRGKLALIAEESDPPSKVWLLREGDAGQWTSFRTGIECYVSGTTSVKKRIVILAGAIYILDLDTDVIAIS